jgi:hypothetical protein
MITFLLALIAAILLLGAETVLTIVGWIVKLVIGLAICFSLLLVTLEHWS